MDADFNKAKEFLDRISGEDKVAVIHHDDGDGFASGILFYDWCKNKGASVSEFTYVIGKSKLREFELERFDKLIFTDLASGVVGEEIAEIDDKEILFVDHHKKECGFADNVSVLITTDLGYIPASRTAGELTGLKPWLALAGTICDMGQLYSENENYIEEELSKINIDLDYFHNKVSSVIHNLLTYFSGKNKKAFELLEKADSIADIENLSEYSNEIEKEIQRILEDYEKNKERLGDINFYYFESKFHVKGAVVSIISLDNPDEKFIIANPRSGDSGRISISGRHQSDKANMPEILEAGVEGLGNANAGGHKRAAGASINKEDLEKFKENVRNFISRQ